MVFLSSVESSIFSDWTVPARFYGITDLNVMASAWELTGFCLKLKMRREEESSPERFIKLLISFSLVFEPNFIDTKPCELRIELMIFCIDSGYRLCFDRGGAYSSSFIKPPIWVRYPCIWET